MDEIKRALLGDKKAQMAVTERGELLPCPICNSNNTNIIESKQLKYVMAECRSCGYQINVFDEIKYKTIQDMTDAIFEKWNARPQILTAEEMERLEGLE